VLLSLAMSTKVKVSHVHKITFECIHCQRTRVIEVHENMGIELGTVIKPYSGGGNWGQCLFCKKGGLRATEATPVKKKGPVGWRSRG
jgi:hypothetical protein